MLKRKFLATLIIGVIAVPSLILTAFATQHEFSSPERANVLSTRASFVTCSCYTSTSSNIREHTGDFYNSCSHDNALLGVYSCTATNNAKTTLGRCEYAGYKDAYVYERNASGETKTSYKSAQNSDMPSTAQVNPANSFVPVCVRHEVSTPTANQSSTCRLHSRNYQ